MEAESLKPILILDFEYKYYGQRLCGECKKPVYIQDKEGYIKDFKYCPHCGMEVEKLLEGDEVIYAKKNYMGYEYFDKTEKIRREEEIAKKRNKMKNSCGHTGYCPLFYGSTKDAINQILQGFYSYIFEDQDLEPSKLKRLQEACKIISEVAEEMK